MVGFVAPGGYHLGDHIHCDLQCVSRFEARNQELGPVYILFGPLHAVHCSVHGQHVVLAELHCAVDGILLPGEEIALCMNFVHASWEHRHFGRSLTT